MIKENNNYLAPIILFAYNRPWHVEQTLLSLTKNELAKDSIIYIFVDGCKLNANCEQIKKQTQVIDIINEYKSNFKESYIEISPQNRGLANSIIYGVSKVINQWNKVIVVEDDIVTGKYFLTFMNEALNRYINDKQVWHITGWHIPIETDKVEECFFYPVMDCWGWATWANRWKYFEKCPEKLINEFTKEKIKEFNVNGLCPSKWNQIIGNYNRRVCTWAIFWYVTIFLQGGLCLAPCSSLVKNIGMDNSGVHGKKNRNLIIKRSIDNKIKLFPAKIEENNDEYELIKKEYKKQFIWQRIYFFIRTHRPLSYLYKIYEYIYYDLWLR
jgi:hypothetical protein